MQYRNPKIESEDDFDELFKAHFSHLVLYVETIVKSQNVSEDIVQDLFVRLWEKRNNLSITTVLLYVCARNASMSYLRTKKITCNIDEIQLSNSQSEQFELEIEYHKRIETVAQKVMKLSPMCRKTIEKIYFENKKYNEAAVELGISVNTIKYHLKTAIKTLKKDFIYFIIYF